MAHHVYLRSVRVEGFRGVGPPVTLDVSARSRPDARHRPQRVGQEQLRRGARDPADRVQLSLVESLEGVARGWRNLHHPEPASISATFAIEGQRAEIEIARSWAAGAAIDDSRLEIRPKDRDRRRSRPSAGPRARSRIGRS